MRTKKITLFYKLSDSEIFAPDAVAISRKDSWIKEIQRTIGKAGETRIVKVTYEIFNPEVIRQQRFFNGPVIDYYTIQNEDLRTGEVPHEMHLRYREEILSQMLGYEVELVGRKERRRKSTADFTSTQQWNDMLERIRETLYEPEGFEMPDSEHFWELQKKYGDKEAEKIVKDQLLRRMWAKNKAR